MALISVMGLYEYDNTIFDGAVFPSGMDRETIINSIILETAEMETLYASPSSFKTAVNIWSKRELPTWQRMYDASIIEYNPVWNVDGTVTETEQRNLNRQTNGSGSVTDSNSGTSQNIEQVTGFDSNTFVDATKNTDTVSNTGNRNETTTGALTDAETVTHSKRQTGNIGVTTTQQMLRSEIELSPFMNVTNYILKSFKRYMCVAVY